MTTYIIRRLLMVPLMVLGISLISFAIIQLAPGTAGEKGETLSSNQQTKERLKILSKSFHLDKPIHVRYFYWVSGMLKGELGQSVSTPTISVKDKLLDHLPITIILNVIVIFILYTVSIPMGIFSAVKHNTFMDKVSTTFLFVLYSLPNFWVAILLIKLMVELPKGYRLPIQGIFPVGSEEMPTLTLLWECTKHLFLPVICLSYGGLAALSRFMRVGMIDILRADFIRTARAKGCTEPKIIFVHALRNSLIPVITLIAGMLPAMIGGSVIIETIFSIPGMGFLGYNAVLERDFTVLMAVLTFSAVLTLVGILISDLLYVIVDPRISFEKAG